MEIRRHDEEEVYEASRTGSIEYLNRLIEKDPDILRRVSLQTGKTGTPLHVSALLGHAEFTKALCTNNPKLAERVDIDGRTPLHLASAEGHKETVEALLSVYAAACLRYDEKGRIPLHYAAMNGEVKVLKKLIDKSAESIYVKVENRSKETVLHLCIIHNQLECLKLFVERDDKNGEFLNSRAGCDGGVTILHLALMLRQIKTIRYLLSIDAIRAEATGVNGMSLTMLDILEYSNVAIEDFSRSLEIQQILMDAGLIRRENNEDENPNSVVAAAAVVVSPNSSSTIGKGIKASKEVLEKIDETVKKSEKGSRPAGRCWKEFMKRLRNPSDWVAQTRGMLMVVATVISTMTFQAAVNPPGRVWQNNETNSANSIATCTEERPCIAGTAVLGYIWQDEFVTFIKYNTIAFLASLSVTLLLVSGFPLHNRLCTWLLSMTMCVTLTFMALTYLNAMFMIVPGYTISGSSTGSTRIYLNSFLTWIALLAIVGVVHTVRFLIWVKSLKWLRQSLKWLRQSLKWLRQSLKWLRQSLKWLRPMYFRLKSCLKNMVTSSFSRNDPTRTFPKIDAPVVV